MIKSTQLAILTEENVWIWSVSKYVWSDGATITKRPSSAGCRVVFAIVHDRRRDTSLAALWTLSACLIACCCTSMNDEDAVLARKRTVSTNMTPEPEFWRADSATDMTTRTGCWSTCDRVSTKDERDVLLRPGRSWCRKPPSPPRTHPSMLLCQMSSVSRADQEVLSTSSYSRRWSHVSHCVTACFEGQRGQSLMIVVLTEWWAAKTLEPVSTDWRPASCDDCHRTVSLAELTRRQWADSRLTPKSLFHPPYHCCQPRKGKHLN